MNLTVLLVVVFGLLVAAGLFIFGMFKLQRRWNDKVCILCPENKGPCKEAASCETLQEINADFTSRRNELLLGLGQGIAIIAIIIILAVLLLEDKISAEAAVPIMAALGGLVFGKTINVFKKSGLPKTENKQDTPK